MILSEKYRQKNLFCCIRYHSITSDTSVPVPIKKCLVGPERFNKYLVRVALKRRALNPRVPQFFPLGVPTADTFIPQNAMATRRSQYWVFTLNNYTEEDCKDIVALTGDESDCPLSFSIFGREVSSTGTPHLQGYIEAKKKVRCKTVKGFTTFINEPFKRAHLESRKGTAEEAAAYCRKDGDYVSKGSISQPSQQGRRTDLDDIKARIDDGATDLDLFTEKFATTVRYYKAFREYRGLRAPKSIRSVAVFALVGEPGTGKSRLVFEREPDLWINSCPTLKWFDGYSGETAVLLDDYRGGADDSTLLRLLDIYPLKVAIKGGFVPWTPARIYITSNLQPPFGHDAIAAPLRRRIRRTVLLSQPLDFDDKNAVDQILQELN